MYICLQYDCWVDACNARSKLEELYIILLNQRLLFPVITDNHICKVGLVSICRVCVLNAESRVG